jgi:hypothetical protein
MIFRDPFPQNGQIFVIMIGIIVHRFMSRSDAFPAGQAFYADVQAVIFAVIKDQAAAVFGNSLRLGPVFRVAFWGRFSVDQLPHPYIEKAVSIENTQDFG